MKYGLVLATALSLGGCATFGQGPLLQRSVASYSSSATTFAAAAQEAASGLRAARRDALLDSQIYSPLSPSNEGAESAGADTGETSGATALADEATPTSAVSAPTLEEARTAFANLVCDPAGDARWLTARARSVSAFDRSITRAATPPQDNLPAIIASLATPLAPDTTALASGQPEPPFAAACKADIEALLADGLRDDLIGLDESTFGQAIPIIDLIQAAYDVLKTGAQAAEEARRVARVKNLILADEARTETSVSMILAGLAAEDPSVVTLCTRHPQLRNCQSSRVKTRWDRAVVAARYASATQAFRRYLDLTATATRYQRLSGADVALMQADMRKTIYEQRAKLAEALVQVDAQLEPGDPGSALAAMRTAHTDLLRFARNELTLAETLEALSTSAGTLEGLIGKYKVADAAVAAVD